VNPSWSGSVGGSAVTLMQPLQLHIAPKKAQADPHFERMTVPLALGWR
jgi:hypothetical protein